MAIYLGLGANLGDRRAQLGRAIDELEARGVRVLRCSPVVESPALLPQGAPDDWNRPFLNLVAECETDRDPEALLAVCKAAEAALGRDNPARWSPRPIDIDILLWHEQRVVSDSLLIPHPGLLERNFVLAPLVALDPGLRVPGHGNKTILQHSHELAHRIPLWMGIVNVTPDSFSDGGRLSSRPELERHVDAMVEAGAQIIDLGAQSTRPGAAPLDAARELDRLLPALEAVSGKYQGRRPRPLISVDTYHAEVARQALALGADMINDVGGLMAPEMIELAAASRADWIAMHQISLPADPGRTLPLGDDPSEHVARWLEARLEAWQGAGMDLGRIVFDPGIGFGKTALQSLQLLRRLPRFRDYGLRLLIGHSRKSFLKSLVPAEDIAARDLATIGASLHLAGQGVDILRVHDVPAHVTAYRGWAHLN